MNILFYCEGDDGQRMLDGLQAALTKLPGQHTIYNGHDINISIQRESIDAAVVWQPPPDFFDNLPALENVFALAAGVDQLLLHPGLPAHVSIIRLEDAGMAQQMAEYVLYGVLRAQRHFHLFDAAQRQSNWIDGLPVRAAQDLHVGILGTGVLGTAVASRLVLNGYTVSGWSRTAKPPRNGIRDVYGLDALPGMLARCDVLVCLLPLTVETRGILNRSLFSQLPRGAFLINCARGAHLIEQDLLHALQTEHLSGAMLDVFDVEPLPQDHPFWDNPRILVTPHEAARSLITQSVEQVMHSIRQVENGDKPEGLIERSRGY